MYRMRYGFLITCIASIKMATKNKSIISFLYNIIGFVHAAKKNAPYLVNEKEGKFIRRLRWSNIKRKLFA
jgi:hypothetical protein